MASIRPRKERGNRYELHYVDVDGSRVRIDTKTTDKKIAMLWQKKAEELLSLAKLGHIKRVGKIDASVVAGKTTEAKSTSPTLEEFCTSYEERCRIDYELAPKTIINTTLAFRSLIAAVGNKRLSELSDKNLLDWKQAMTKQGKTKTTMGIYFRHLRAAFNRAVRFYKLDDNPFLHVEEPKEKRRRKPAKDMSIDEGGILLNAIEEVEDYQFANYVRFLLYTGCRRTEILNLRWEQIDLENKWLIVYAEKTKRDLTLPINKALLRVIEAMEVKQKGFVFQTNSTGRGAGKNKPWHKDYVTHHFKAYITTLGLPNQYSLHALRHTYSNFLLQKGVPLDIVQKLLGHSSVRTTLENYDATVAIHFRDQADLVDFEAE